MSDESTPIIAMGCLLLLVALAGALVLLYTE